MTAIVPVRRETRDLWDVAEDLERVFDAPFDASLFPAMRVREGLWHPTMDVYERPADLRVELEIPGVNKSDVDIRIEENHLIVEGKRDRDVLHKDESPYYGERSYGGFHRIVHLPSSVDAERVEATFSNGILSIRLPKVKREGGTKIDIKGE